MGLPYQLLGVLVAVVIAAVGGYRHGVGVESGRQAKAMQQAIIATFEQTRADTEAEAAARQAAAEKDAAAETAARDAKQRGQAHALRTDRADCRWPAERRLCINAAIHTANTGTPAGADGVCEALQPVAGAER